MLNLLGADTLRGGDGDDVIQSSEGVDEFYGAEENDVLQ